MYLFECFRYDPKIENLVTSLSNEVPEIENYRLTKGSNRKRIIVSASDAYKSKIRRIDYPNLEEPNSSSDNESKDDKPKYSLQSMQNSLQKSFISAGSYENPEESIPTVTNLSDNSDNQTRISDMENSAKEHDIFKINDKTKELAKELLSFVEKQNYLSSMLVLFFSNSQKYSPLKTLENSARRCQLPISIKCATKENVEDNQIKLQ